MCVHLSVLCCTCTQEHKKTVACVIGIDWLKLQACTCHVMGVVCSSVCTSSSQAKQVVGLGYSQSCLRMGNGCGNGQWSGIDAVIVSIPKRGDLYVCDNWHGISLLDVVDKLCARLMLQRLQRIGEGILPDSQYGFRKGRGCVDMIFAARQLFGKIREHNDSLFVLFVDLEKAYNQVPRWALWFSIYFSAMVANWRELSPEAGVNMKYKHGRKLVGTAQENHVLSV